MIDFKFQVYTKRNEQVETVETMKAALIEGRYDDDAIWPFASRLISLVLIALPSA